MPDSLPEENIRSFTQTVRPFLAENKVSLLLFTAALSPLLIYFGLSIYSKAQSEIVLRRHEKLQEATTKRQREEYQKLIEAQSKKSQSKNNDQREETRKAVGRYTLHVFLVKSPTLQTSNISELIDNLEEQDKQSPTSLYYINTFYKKWAKKYNITDFDIDIKFHGPYDLGTLEQIGDIGLYWDKDPFATTRLQDTFTKIAADNNVKIADKDLAIFLYFDNSFTESTSNDQDRFYEHKKFRSFADDTTGKAYINVYNLQPAFAKTVTEIVGHEVLHLFGANDKYEESESVTRICSERDRGDLELRPRLPQKTADIMCMYVEKEDDEFIRGSFAKDTLSINQLTAKEIGWIKI